MDSKPFTPRAGWSSLAEANHAIPDDGYEHLHNVDTCPCEPISHHGIVEHNHHREYTEAEQEQIRQADAYDPEDSDVSDEIIARGTFVRDLRRDGSMSPAQIERAALIAENRGIDVETAQELVYLRDVLAASVRCGECDQVIAGSRYCFVCIQVLKEKLAIR